MGGSICVLAFDQVTKQIVIERFHLGESISILEGFFNLTYIRNTGAAFGILADAHPAFRIPFFIAVPLVALGVIFSIFRKLPSHSVFMASALAFVVGGAIGNLIDRIRLGFVVDFLDFHWKFKIHYPAFNVADSAILIGVFMILLDLFINPEESS